VTTRILATIGPNSLNEETLRRCAEADVYLYRINLSHTPVDQVAPFIEKIQRWCDVPVCLDSEGAQLRNQNMVDGAVDFSKGDKVNIHFSAVLGDHENISFTPLGSADQFEVGDTIRIDFNGTEFNVLECLDDRCIAKVTRGGRVGSNKAADIDRDVSLTAITKDDEAAIKIGREMGVRHFALSFASTAADVKRMRTLCGSDAKIISKIESLKALESLPAILQETDDILIDRGDLSRQVPLEKIPFLQRRIIAMAKAHDVPVYVATNLLESMIDAHAPTRAELNDVVSTLLMGADGLVLAAETAIGAYPIEAVHMIRSLANTTRKWTSHSSIEDVLQF
jgi:pyruvate kinase